MSTTTTEQIAPAGSIVWVAAIETESSVDAQAFTSEAAADAHMAAYARELWESVQGEPSYYDEAGNEQEVPDTAPSDDKLAWNIYFSVSQEDKGAVHQLVIAG